MRRSNVLLLEVRFFLRTGEVFRCKDCFPLFRVAGQVSDYFSCGRH